MSTRTRAWTPGTPCWVDLTTPDPEGARTFYGALLGWEFEVAGPELGGYALASSGGAVAAGMATATGQPPAWTLYFATEDAEATARSVTSAGGRVLAGPLEIPGRGTMVVFADPVGAVAGAWRHGPFIGCGVVNEPGALVWEDLRSSDPDLSRGFLTSVFGLTHRAVEGLPPDYTLLHLDEPYPVGGAGPLFGAPEPHWGVYFGVADAEAAVARATAHGGQVIRPVDVTPYGRMAVLADPSGAPFVVIENTGRPQPDRA